MKIVFDNTTPIAGIGLVPWTRLGPERWFSNYKIASLYGWDLQGIAGAPEVVAVADQPGPFPELKKLRSQHLVDSHAFQDMAVQQLPGYSFLTYKPITLPQTVLNTGSRALSMNQELTESLENKVEFRERFADLQLPIPPYKIVERASLEADAVSLQGLLAGRQEVIVQDEHLGGGRGTFALRTVADLAYALTSIAKLEGGKRLVVSDRISPVRERSVQCCATRYGVFVGPLQKQIIGHPLLANLAVPEGDRFCGAEISPQDPLLGLYPQVRAYAEQIGQRLLELGYRGIFSVDCLVDSDDQVYVIEVNPRLTGITPLLTMLYREGQDVPFYLLHILETAGIDYEITDATISEVPPTGSLLVVHSDHKQHSYLQETVPSGLYDLGNLAYKGKAYRLPLDQPDSLLVQRYTPPHFLMKPGGRLLSIFSTQAVLDDADTLLPDVSRAVTHLKQHTKLKDIV